MRPAGTLGLSAICMVFNVFFNENALLCQTLDKAEMWVFHVFLQMSGLGVKMGLFTRFFRK